MFDIGFFEVAIIGVVLLVVMGPERLPEVARQTAFLIRKVRGWVYNIKAEMRIENDDVMAPFKAASQEMTDLKNDISQIGKDMASDVEQTPQEVKKEKSGLEKTKAKQKAKPKKAAAKKSPVNKEAAAEKKNPEKKAPVKKKAVSKKDTQK